MAGHVERRHAERIGLELERFLAAEEGFAAERIDLRDLFVGHRVAAARRAVAMDHQLRAGMAERAVIGVRIAGIEREIIGRLRVHLRWRDRIETFRGLAVAFANLRSEIAGPAANRVGLQQCEAAGTVLLPDLELGFLLEQPDQDRRLQIHVLGVIAANSLGGTGWLALALVASEPISSLLQPASSTACRQRGRCHERANQRATDQCKAPHPTGKSRTPN